MAVGAIRTLSRTLDSAVRCPGPPSDDSSATTNTWSMTPAGAMDATFHWPYGRSNSVPTTVIPNRAFVNERVDALVVVTDCAWKGEGVSSTPANTAAATRRVRPGTIGSPERQEQDPRFQGISGLLAE